jgi:hypothetical protein
VHNQGARRKLEAPTLSKTHMNYRDIIREMKMEGHYSEAEALARSVGSEHDRVYTRNDARDGLPFISYAGDVAERAYDSIRNREWREQEQREQEQREMYQRERDRERTETRRTESADSAQSAWNTNGSTSSIVSKPANPKTNNFNSTSNPKQPTT